MHVIFVVARRYAWAIAVYAKSYTSVYRNHRVPQIKSSHTQHISIACYTSNVFLLKITYATHAIIIAYRPISSCLIPRLTFIGPITIFNIFV